MNSNSSNNTDGAADNNGNNKLLTYNSYLQLDSVLNACRRVSPNPVHDEHLFIITHQTFELWFKQILFEIDSIRAIFSTSSVNERDTLVVVSRLQRIVAIFKLCVSQFEILETMTPLDFLEFRTILRQSSGFQSVQFRLIENKLGVLPGNRIQYAKCDYKEKLQCQEHVDRVTESEKADSLFVLIEKWLERTPGALDENYWTLFDQGAQQWLNDTFEQQGKQSNNKELDYELAKQKEVFERLSNKETFELLRQKGEIRLSHSAFLGALFILLWRSEPRFSQPYQILSLLMDVDSLLTKMRYAHVTMVHRMIGAKIGTGGSSGYQYLRSTISDRYKVFTDLFNLSTYIIPRAYLPPLPASTRCCLSTWNILLTSSNNINNNVNIKDNDGKADEDQENALISRITSSDLNI